MIDINNLNCDLTPEGRRTSLQRAIYTQPYFYRFEFPITAGDPRDTQFSQNVGINRDFFITEWQGNFGEVLRETGSLFNVTLYSAYYDSLYRFEAGHKLPTGQVLTEARFRTPITNEKFDDRQAETFPYLVRKNDKIYAQIANVNVKNDVGNANIVLKGFNVNEDAYITPMQTEQYNASLAKDVEWQFFKINVTDQGVKQYILENDNQPRLILGFCAINSVSEKAQVSEINVSITEIARRLRLTDTKIPLQFIAPRLTCLRDTHIYYLPVEFAFQPYSKLQFDIENIWVNDQTPAGAEISILTRTV